MDYFFLLNQDAHISWDNLFKMAKIQSLNPDYGILSPIQMFTDSKIDYLHYKSLLAGDMGYFNDLMSNNNIKDLYTIKYTNAALWMISRKCIETLGGFDPLFPHYGEDHEYANRLTFFKLKFGICPNIKSYHYRKQDVERELNAKGLFNAYLIQVKNLNTNLFVAYVKILFKIFFGILGGNKSARWSKLYNSLVAYFKLVFLIKKVRNNRVLNIKNKLVFLS
jgi:GT2 family glycosyltransferase